MKKIKIGDALHDLDTLSDEQRELFSLLEYSASRITELTNTSALLTKARAGYISTIKSEILASKSGLIIDE